MWQSLSTLSAKDGTPKTANVCNRAIAAAFLGGLPWSVEVIQSEAADFSAGILEALEAVDQEFFVYPHHLSELLYNFVTSHPGEFGAVPRPD